MDQKINSNHIRAYAQLFFMSICFSGTFIVGRILASHHVSPTISSFLRFVIASIVLVTLLWQREKKLMKPTARQFISLFLLALIGVCIYNLGLLFSLQHISTSRCAVIVATNPVFIALISAVVFKEKISIVRILGILICFSGAVTVSTHGDWSSLNQTFNTPELVVLMCALSWATYSVLVKPLLESMSPLACLTYTALIGLILLSIVAMLTTDLSEITKLGIEDWCAILYMAIFGTVLSFLCYYQGIKVIGVVNAGAFINLTPAITMVLGVFILDEYIDLAMVVGTILTIIGVFFVNSKNTDLMPNIEIKK